MPIPQEAENEQVKEGLLDPLSGSRSQNWLICKLIHWLADWPKRTECVKRSQWTCWILSLWLSISTFTIILCFADFCSILFLLTKQWRWARSFLRHSIGFCWTGQRVKLATLEAWEELAKSCTNGGKHCPQLQRCSTMPRRRSSPARQWSFGWID